MTYERSLRMDWLVVKLQQILPKNMYELWFLEACSLAKSGQIFHKLIRAYVSHWKTLFSLISSYWFRAGKWLQFFKGRTCKGFLLKSFHSRKMCQPFSDFFWNVVVRGGWRKTTWSGQLTWKISDWIVKKAAENSFKKELPGGFDNSWCH